MDSRSADRDAEWLQKSRQLDGQLTGDLRARRQGGVDTKDSGCRKAVRTTKLFVLQSASSEDCRGGCMLKAGRTPKVACNLYDLSYNVLGSS